MLGVHPQSGRDLTELEEGAHRWVTLLADSPIVETDQFSEALELWRQNWPGWKPSPEAYLSEDKLIKERWRFLLPHCTPIAAAYVFRAPAPRTLTERDMSEAQYREAFQYVRAQMETGCLPRGSIAWATSFPTGRLRDVFEQLAGLSPAVKERLGLDDHDPGFLRRYATAHQEAFENLVSPRQFEHLVADMYKNDGWDCRVTRYSKDDGIDIEASRTTDGIPTVLLIQVKRNRSAGSLRGPERPVGVGDVKAFAATVRAEGKDAGVLVTSSRISCGAAKWATGKGQRVANISFLNGAELRQRLSQIARTFREGEISSYILNANTHPTA